MSSNKLTKIITTGLGSAGILAAVPLSMSAAVSEEKTFQITYKGMENIEASDLTTSYDSSNNTKLKNPKAKAGFIFVGWKTNDGFPIDVIPASTNENLILTPNLIAEYPNYSKLKSVFVAEYSQKFNDENVRNINDLIAKEEATFGFQKYPLQKQIANLINKFNDKKTEEINKEWESKSGSLVSHTIEYPSNKLVNYAEKPKSWADTFSYYWKKWVGPITYGLLGIGGAAGIGYGVYKLTDNAKNKVTKSKTEEQGQKDQQKQQEEQKQKEEAKRKADEKERLREKEEKERKEKEQAKKETEKRELAEKRKQEEERIRKEEEQKKAKQLAEEEERKEAEEKARKEKEEEEKRKNQKVKYKVTYDSRGRRTNQGGTILCPSCEGSNTGTKWELKPDNDGKWSVEFEGKQGSGWGQIFFEEKGGQPQYRRPWGPRGRNSRIAISIDLTAINKNKKYSLQDTSGYLGDLIVTITKE